MQYYTKSSLSDNRCNTFPVKCNFEAFSDSSETKYVYDKVCGNDSNDPAIQIPINKGYVHTLKVRATAEGGASLETDTITIQVNCDILP